MGTRFTFWLGHCRGAVTIGKLFNLSLQYYAICQFSDNGNASVNYLKDEMK